MSRWVATSIFRDEYMLLQKQDRVTLSEPESSRRLVGQAARGVL